jgi:hypothetical protein
LWVFHFFVRGIEPFIHQSYFFASDAGVLADLVQVIESITIILIHFSFEY